MDYTKEEFERKLIAFFDRHDPVKKYVVPALVEEFQGQEEEVFAELTQRYVDSEDDDDDNRTKKTSGGGGPSVPSTPNTGGNP